MSDYRPWAPTKDDPVDDEGDGAGEPYAPWAPGQATSPPPKEKRFETPPGLGQAPARRKGAAHETAGAMLLWTGGFLLFGSIAFMAAMTLAIDFEHIDMRHGGYGDYDDVQAMQQIRGVGAWGIAASMVFIIPGMGLLYEQTWARPWAYVAASLSLVLLPIGTVLGIIGLSALSRMEAP